MELIKGENFYSAVVNFWKDINELIHVSYRDIVNSISIDIIIYI